MIPREHRSEGGRWLVRGRGGGGGVPGAVEGGELRAPSAAALRLPPTAGLRCLASLCRRETGLRPSACAARLCGVSNRVPLRALRHE
ncbi:unnamed protein product [Caretta caretta]